MRLLLLGAMPYPFAQGSQVYLREQALALQAAGAEVDLLTYPARPPAKPLAGPAEPRHLESPRWTAPRRMRSGPSLAKPLADLGLAIRLRHAVGLSAASTRCPESVPARYDAIMTHNAEACVIALAALPIARPAVVYCAHTLMGRELSSYLDPPLSPSESALSRLSTAFRDALKPRLDAVGAEIDRRLARHVDGWIALTHQSTRVMRHQSRAPGALIPPPLPDPLADRSRLDPRATAESHGLEPGRYLLYSGNLDPYQELGLLLEAARRRRTSARAGNHAPLVVATHDVRAERLFAPLAEAGIRLIRVMGTPAGADGEGREGRTRGVSEESSDTGVAEMQALIAGARATVCLRRSLGGFPIKLANSLALGTPPIAYHAREWGLAHGENAWIISPEDPVLSLTRAIDQIARHDGLAERLRPGARALYRSQHEPARVAALTLALVDRVLVHRTEQRSGHRRRRGA